MAIQRKRTIRLYRITDDGRRLLAGTLRPALRLSLWRAGARSWPPRRVAPMPHATAMRPLALSLLMRWPMPLGRVR
jgi:hypothetical protein